MGCGLQWSAEEIHKSGLDFDAEKLDAFCKDLIDYKYTYLVEAFILANLTGSATADILSALSDAAMLINCDKEEIRVTAQVAKSMLTNNFDLMLELPAPSEDKWVGKFCDYIPQEWLIAHRIKCAKLLTNRYFNLMEMSQMFSQPNDLCSIKNKLPRGTMVKKGDRICSYTKQAQDGKNISRDVLASCDGIVFFTEKRVNNSEYTIIYVISFYDDYKDFSKWLKDGAKQGE